MAVGVVRDSSVGPLLMVGAGGVTTGVLANRVPLLLPVRPSDVRRALRGLGCWPLLEGFRGAPSVDLASLVDVVVRVGRLAEEIPEVAEVDAKPVMVSSEGCALVDLKLRLADNHAVAQISSAAGLSDEPRQLRRTV